MVCRLYIFTSAAMVVLDDSGLKRLGAHKLFGRVVVGICISVNRVIAYTLRRISKGRVAKEAIVNTGVQ